MPARETRARSKTKSRKRANKTKKASDDPSSMPNGKNVRIFRAKKRSKKGKTVGDETATLPKEKNLRRFTSKSPKRIKKHDKARDEPSSLPKEKALGRCGAPKRMNKLRTTNGEPLSSPKEKNLGKLSLPKRCKKIKKESDEPFPPQEKNINIPMKRSNVLKKTLYKKRSSKIMKTSFKNAYEDQLRLFNERRKRAKENNKLKKKCSVSLSQLIVEKPSENSWITSGSSGSKDAVLVFRASILKPKDQESLTKTVTPSLTPESTQNANDRDKDVTEVVSSASRHMFNVATNNLNESQPNNCNISAQHSKSHLQKDNIKIKLSNSLSSSDNSISSDGSCDFVKDTSDSKGNVQSEMEKISLAEDDLEYEGKEEAKESGEDDMGIVYSPNMPALQMKLTYRFIQTETMLLRNIFNCHGLSEVKNEDTYSILWTGVHLKADLLRHLRPYQRVNHFPRSFELTRKDRLYKNIERMQHLRGYKHFDFVPQSFVLPLEYKDLLSSHNKHRGPWIVKPAASSRGRGIYIVNGPDEIPQDEQLLVSKYVADPLCIDEHKCDLRVYVLVTSFNPLIIYIYEEGLVRLATVKYEITVNNLWNPCMHLCNYSINKFNTDYIKSLDAEDEDVGHKWTMSALLRHLKSQRCDTTELMSNIEDIIIKALLSCSQRIVSACRMFVPDENNCFELYGFDILIDDSLKPWLIEVNLSPSMAIESPLDSRVKACLMTDVLTCVGIPAVSPETRAHYDSKWTRNRNVSCSRVPTSADTGRGNSNGGSRRLNGLQTQVPLTTDEKRIIKNARLQNARRGGFVRIFPTDDTMQRYGCFLDPATGISLSTPLTQGQIVYSMISPYNYNQMLFDNLYGKDSRDNGVKEGNTLDERMFQYLRVLPLKIPILFIEKQVAPKSAEEGKKLRKQIVKLMCTGSELTQLQARQSFSSYLDTVSRRLSQEPKDLHEKLILKFLNRVGGAVKAPVFFRSPQNLKVLSKARTAMIAKLLGDFLEQYNRDTESYVELFDNYGMIPNDLFNAFLSNAEEYDLEEVLTLSTNMTGKMSYLYNRHGICAPPTPPIPSGMYGFLRALPAMVISGSMAREFNKTEGYYKKNERDLNTFKNSKLPEEKIKK